MIDAEPDARRTRGPVTVALVAGSRRLARGGTIDLSIEVSLAPGFRIGSVAPDPRGETEPTVVQLGVAEGLVPGAMRFPEGSVNPLGGERLRSYAGTVTITVPISAAADALLGPAPVAARVLFQAVGDGGAPAADRIEVSSTLEIVDGPPAQPRSAETSS